MSSLINVYSIPFLLSSLAILVCRVIRVRKHRFRRLRALELQYRHLEDSPEEMTYEEANEIMKLALYWDMPWSSVIGLSIGSFKAVAIPTMSDVMLKSDALRSAGNAKRHTELETIFIFDMITEGLDSVRGSTALARINFLHSRYSKLIRNEDMLFALALFIFEPVDWAARYEWRALTVLEVQARYVFWREMGARMGIQGIPPSRSGLKGWMEQYANGSMVCTASTKQLGKATLDALLPPLIRPVKSFIKKIVTSLLDSRTRRAFGWTAETSRPLRWTIQGIFQTRALLVGYLCMPRTSIPAFLSSLETERIDSFSGNKEVRIIRRESFIEPYFMASSKAEYSPEGYTSATLGPARLTSAGVEATLQEAQEMRERAMICPFFSQ